jgi:hypothetical protein
MRTVLLDHRSRASLDVVQGRTQAIALPKTKLLPCFTVYLSAYNGPPRAWRLCHAARSPRKESRRPLYLAATPTRTEEDATIDATSGNPRQDVSLSLAQILDPVRALTVGTTV